MCSFIEIVLNRHLKTLATLQKVEKNPSQISNQKLPVCFYTHQTVSQLFVLIQNPNTATANSDL